MKTLATKLMVAPVLGLIAPLSMQAAVELQDSTNHYPKLSEVDVKTNLLYDLNSTINLGVEFPISRSLSLDISGNYNAWTMSENRKWKHWLLQPELRYWPGDRQHGQFFGLHILGGQFNLNKVTLPFNLYPDLTNRRYQGWGVGAGLGYGYRWNFSQRWAGEAEVGVGGIYARYDKFCTVNCGVRTGFGSGFHIAPTKLAISLIYRFGKPEKSFQRNVRDYLVRTLNEEIEATRRAAEREIERMKKRYPSQVDRLRIDTVYIRDNDRAGQNFGKCVNGKSQYLTFSFPWSSAELSDRFNGNAQQTAELEKLINEVCNNSQRKVAHIEISGYSSPEGSFTLNQQLSQQRAENMAKIICNLCPEMEKKLTTIGHGEDWDGMLKLLPNMPRKLYRDAIEKLCTETPIMEGREKKLMELYGGRPYFYLEKNIFPQLRRIEVVVELANP